ncbi:MAG TPA: N-acetylglucosamine-specific PTS transporter subunit IIBC [Usitatibacter sp.]|nr:N-acetylglucosamine-specific PTS transporter subunit IIBC [Usitatibacter sp.]
MKRFLDATQKLGGALMLPIAVLPVAGLLLRLGQPDLLNFAPLAAAGDAIFSNLGLLFAIGVAVGLAKENHGAAGLAGVVGFLVATKGAEVLLGLPPAEAARQLAKLSVPIGLITGMLAGVLYNRYHNAKLPSYLAFFGGKRFVPIVTGAAGIVLAFVFGLGWPAVSAAMDGLSRAVIASGELGLFVYGVLNRVLIVTGLHHILNNVAWFLVGDYNGVTGDLKRFFAGDPTAGVFMAGFFPVMMFGLPAACLAMYHTALPERRRAVGGLMLSMALTSFLTGVTEPIEFTFMFLAPWLYALHAVLTGAAMVTMDLLQSRLGFGFSAGLFDYVLNFNKATHPWYLLPVGAAYFALYYFLFRYCIARFNLRTPGREREVAPNAAVPAANASDREVALAYIGALGGAANLVSVDACTTRLRLELANREAANDAALRALGARGTVRVGVSGLQVVVGPMADQVAGAIRAALHEAAPAPLDTRAILAALGGSANMDGVEAAGGRVLVTVRDASRIDEAALRRLGVRGVARADSTHVQLLHPDPARLHAELAAAPV